MMVMVRAHGKYRWVNGDGRRMRGGCVCVVCTIYMCVGKCEVSCSRGDVQPRKDQLLTKSGCLK